MAGGIITVVHAFLGGLIFALAYVKTKSLFPAIAAHIFGNIGGYVPTQPVMERMITYIPAVFITFICWGIWHFLFFYIDGSLTGINAPLFLLGLLTNCFILSALYAYSGSLWICVMTHALINALSQVAVDEKVMLGIILKIVCIAIAIGLYYMVSRQKV
ncbi:MAG: CPBP family intramembrane metalloprotease [Lachnospiraceae bacterium]|nr:CPBP family intramembrane metalloprotease [Lachnospiraceae bacterium]